MLVMCTVAQPYEALIGHATLWSNFETLGQGLIQADAIDVNASVRKKLPMHSSVRFLPQII